jgi:membrane associated rhomboid family serine protease
MKRYPGTFFVLLTSVAIQVIISFLPWIDGAFDFFPGGGVPGWLGLLAHMFAHSGWPHLINNFSFGLPFCMYLESKVGKTKFLELYVLCGFGSAFLNTLLMGGAMVGSSGALFGVFAASCLIFGDTWQEHVLGLVLFTTQFTQQLAMAPLGGLFHVAFYGHIGGALMALLLTHRFYRCQPKTS